LTEAGRARLRAIDSARSKVGVELFDALDTAERAELQRLLAKITAEQ